MVVGGPNPEFLPPCRTQRGRIVVRHGRPRGPARDPLHRGCSRKRETPPARTHGIAGSGDPSRAQKIANWTRDHLDLDSFTDKILETAESNQAKQELAGLPELPERFAPIATYLDLLSWKEPTRVELEGQLGKPKIEQGTLSGSAPKETAEEFRADLESNNAN